jgi:uncharacterized protein with NRDE domain
MCLIAFELSHDPSCPLRLASNRDEFWRRPTEALHRWQLPNGVAVWGGRDGQDGGTWLAASEHGRIAWLTNVREHPARTGLHSRGTLVTDWLARDLAWDEWQSLWDPASLAGFNLVVGDLRRGQWAWMSNRSPQRVHNDPQPSWHSQALGAGVYGLSNASLNVLWPKTERLLKALQTPEPAPGPHGWPSHWLAALGDEQLSATLGDDELPLTGVGLVAERALANPFVRWPEHGYGTRSSTLLALRPAQEPLHSAPSWDLHISEWTHDPQQAPFGSAQRRDACLKHWGQVPKA